MGFLAEFPIWRCSSGFFGVKRSVCPPQDTTAIRTPQRPPRLPPCSCSMNPRSTDRSCPCHALPEKAAAQSGTRRRTGRLWVSPICSRFLLGGAGGHRTASAIYSRDGARCWSRSWSPADFRGSWAPTCSAWTGACQACELDFTLFVPGLHSRRLLFSNTR